jgi:homoserine/homoserine lactone efflux protein
MGPGAGLMNVAGTQAGIRDLARHCSTWPQRGHPVHGHVWFDALRYAGAAYLMWLAIKLFRSKGDLAVAVDRARPHGSFFLQGFIVIMSNPKMLVLFGAMIPPFMTGGGEPMQQITADGPDLHGHCRRGGCRLCADGGQGRVPSCRARASGRSRS